MLRLGSHAILGGGELVLPPPERVTPSSVSVGELGAALGHYHVAAFAHGSVGDGHESDVVGCVTGADLLAVG